MITTTTTGHTTKIISTSSTTSVNPSSINEVKYMLEFYLRNFQEISGQENNSTTYGVVGAVLGVVILASIIVVFILFMRKQSNEFVIDYD